MPSLTFLAAPYLSKRLGITSKSHFCPAVRLSRPIPTHRQPLLCPPRAQTAGSQNNSSSDTSSSNLKEPSVEIPPSYILPFSIIVCSALLFYASGDYLPAFPLLLLGIFILIVSVNTRFVLTSTAFVISKRSSYNEFLPSTTWQYTNISDLKTLWPLIPILFYLNESETRNGKPLIHFFPVVCDPVQLMNIFQQRSSLIERPPNAK